MAAHTERHPSAGHEGPAARREAAGRQPAGRRVTSPALVGRAAELAELIAVVSAPPALAVVDGEAGIGKTRLIAELRTRPELAGRRFAVGSCRRIREPFPLGPVIDVIRELPAELAAATLSPVAGALRPLLPEVAHLLPPRPEPLADRHAARHQVFRALVEVFAGLGQAVLVLEDLHWADEQTVDFLSYLLAELPGTLSLVLTFRGDEVDPGVRVLAARAPAAVGQANIVLGPLDAAQTGQLAAAILETDRITEEFAGYLCARTSGLPFAVEELLALLRTRGTLVRRGAGWARKTLAELDVPAGIRDPVLERVSRLPTEAIPVVEAAAVLQTPAPVPVVIATASGSTADEEPVRRGVDHAVASGLLVAAGGSVGFRHLLAAQAVYEAVPGQRRQQLHGRAATAMEALDPVPLGQLAHHLRHAGRPRQWVVAAERAADQAIQLGHDDEAARLLDGILRTGPLDPDQRGRAAVKLGRAAVETLHAGQAVGPLSEVLEQLAPDLPAAVRGELRFLLGMLLDHAGITPGRSWRLYAEAVDDLADRPDLRAWALVGLGLPRFNEVPLAEHKRWLDLALDTLPEVADPEFAVFLLGKIAMVLVLIGDPGWRPVVADIEARTPGTPSQRRELNAYQSVGAAACYVGHHETAARLLTAGVDGARTYRGTRLEGTLRVELAVLDYCRGRWDGLDRLIDELVEQAGGYAPSYASLEVVASCLALARGDLDAARHRLAAVLPRVDAEVTSDLLPLAIMAAARLVSGDDELAQLWALRDALVAKGAWAPGVRALPALTEAMVGAGEQAAAGALVDRVTSEVDGIDAPLAPAALRHARGFLHLADERWAEAARAFLDAAEEYERRTCPYEAAHASERAAGALFRATVRPADGGPAAQALHSALATYQRLGATWDLDRATRLARDHGVPVRARHRGGHRGYGQQLSPRERRVAELAAAGRTNKEIAAELFVSPNTVKHQLAAAMRKLGVPSRAVLADRLTSPTSLTSDAPDR